MSVERENKRAASEMNSEGNGMDLDKAPQVPPPWMQSMMSSLSTTLNQSLSLEVRKSIEPIQQSVNKLSENVNSLQQRMTALETEQKKSPGTASTPNLNPYQRAFATGQTYASVVAGNLGGSSSSASGNYQPRPVGATPAQPREARGQAQFDPDTFQVVLAGFPMNTPTKMIIDTTKDVLARIISANLVKHIASPGLRNSSSCITIRKTEDEDANQVAWGAIERFRELPEVKLQQNRLFLSTKKTPLRKRRNGLLFQAQNSFYGAAQEVTKGNLRGTKNADDTDMVEIDWAHGQIYCGGQPICQVADGEDEPRWEMEAIKRQFPGMEIEIINRYWQKEGLAFRAGRVSYKAA
jgi:hypothetical protein